MGIEDLLNGKELIIKQNCTIKELPSKGLKEFCPNNSWIQKKQIEKKLEEKFNFINTDRIEKSNNISEAEWIPQLKKAKVLKKIGKIWETMGHHQDNEDWLLPEEVLYLVENCELQLILGDICASIEDCYMLLLEGDCCSLDEYRVYSHLCRAGLRLVRHAPSVSVTSYERQVNLDSILQRSKRSPPHSSKDSPYDNEENEVTIIGEDFKILSKSPEREAETVLSNKKQNIDLIEVIEIDDDIDPNPIIEEVVDSSDDSSDIVCISSPSYISSDQGRLWYPPIQKSLLRSMEKIIDLCNDDSPNDLKEIIHNKLDLIEASKSQVLSLLPSAENGVSVIQSPDSRLLPNNVLPRYSEYKVNLNVRSDYNAANKFNKNYSLMPRMPFTNMLNNAQMSPGFINNPLFKKAEEMQAMAMNMIQTASTLMSALNSQNPNELWNLVESRNQDMHFHPRFSVQQQRPFRFPRRNYRPMRRRIPYEKRNGGRYFRKIYESNKVSDSVEHPSNISHSSEVKTEIVVLSDDEEIVDRNSPLHENLSSGKRMKLNNDTTFKKLKTEHVPFDSSIILEESSDILEKQPNPEIKFEGAKLLEVNDTVKDNIKEESASSSHSVKINVALDRPELKCEDNLLKPSTSQTNGKIENIAFDTCLEKEGNQSNISFESDQNSNDENVTYPTDINMLEIEDKQSAAQKTCCNSSKKKTSVPNLIESQEINIDKDLVVTSAITDSCMESNNLQGNYKSAEENPGCKEMNFKTDEGKITTWGEYKSTEGPQLGVDEFLEDTESILQLEDCMNYGDILAALQIFKDVDLAKSRKQFKITYDVYLPETSFKKSMKVLPNFRVIVLKSNEELPTPMDLKSLKNDYQDQIPFLFSVVFNETIGFYLYETISLPSLFD